MNIIAQKIFNADLLLQKSNRQRKIINELDKNLKIFKSLPNDDDFNEVFDYINSKKSTATYINVNLFPDNMNSFRKWREAEFSNNLRYELRWFVSVFYTYKDTLNTFLENKLLIDELILLNEYEKALEHLVTIETKYGSSYWLLENKVYLYSRLKRNIQGEIINKAQDEILKSILMFYDMKTADELSSRDYDYSTRKEISKVKRIYLDSKDLIAFYHYMIAPCSFLMDDENIMYILRYMYNLSLFDRYLCFIDICEYILIKSKNINYKEILKDYIFLLNEINDNSIKVFMFMLDSTENRREKYTINDPLLDIKNMFVSGKIKECNEAAAKYIKENTSNVDAINIYIETNQLLGKDSTDLDVSDNIKLLINNLDSVYSINDKYNESIDAIYKLVFSCTHAIWARDIYNNILRRSQPLNSDSQKVAVMYSNINKLTLETVCENLLTEDAKKYLDSIDSKGNNYIDFWKYFMDGNNLKIIENFKNESLRKLMLLKDSHDYGEFQREIIENIENTDIFKIRFTKVLWDNVTFETYIEESIDYFLDKFIQVEDIALIAPIQKFMDYYLLSEDVDKGNLRVPILYYIYTTYFNTDKNDELYIICEDFFYYNRIDKPSKMDIFSSKYSKNKLIFFLRYICIPQIMGPVLLSIKSSKELDQERIDTCQCLRHLDPDNENEYEQEIRDITHKLFINDGLNSIENSKIHVNTEGIKSKITKSLKSVFNNYMYVRNHKLDAFLETIKTIEGGEHVQIIEFDTQLFNEIVYTIRNEFVSSGEYGLDGYLSLNIRHGTLQAQLRAPLAKYDMLAKFEIENNSYYVSERWLYRVIDSGERKKIIEAIIEFNKETDDIITYLKKTLIQVSTEEKPTKGVFNYELKDGRVKFLQTLLTENIEFEEFIDKVFEYLWQITEYNLQNMKSIIREDIAPRYRVAFSRLSAVIKKVNEINPFPDAIRWLNEAQNDIDAELDKICHWFHRSAESQHADFDLDLAFQIGLKMIENIHPEKRFAISNLNRDFKYKIPGKFLKNYWDIFYTLFDNVSRCAMPKNGQIVIGCDLKVDSTGTYIKMINDYDCSKGVEKEKAKLDAALRSISDANYLARAKQEGGSGIPKIYKILSIDLDKKASIKYSYCEENNQFCIEIEGKCKYY